MPITKQQRDKIKEIFTGTSVVRIEVTFQGGGDSGDINAPEYYNKDGKKIVDEMPNWGMTKDPADTYAIGKLTLFNHVALPITVSTSRERYVWDNFSGPMTKRNETEEQTFKSVDEFIEDLVHGEAMDSGHDWYNNDGGGGSWELDLTTGERSFNMYQYEQREDTVLDTVDKWPGCKLVRKERKREGTKAA
jgi:hypothetical protein